MNKKKSKYGSGTINTYKQFDELTIDDSPKDIAGAYYNTYIKDKSILDRIKNSFKIKKVK
mgnify:CR=1 FL=1